MNLPQLSYDQLLGMLGERDVIISQQAILIGQLQSDLRTANAQLKQHATPANPPGGSPDAPAESVG